MAGLEIVVRPVVFPNIRPVPARSLPPTDDPDKGFAVIRGNGAKQIDLSNSYSSNASTSVLKEIKRRVDVARVYQKEDDGSVNKENFIDMNVTNKMWMEGAPKQKGFNGDDLVPGDGSPQDVATSQKEKGQWVKEGERWVFAPMGPSEHVKILENDKIIFYKGEAPGTHP